MAELEIKGSNKFIKSFSEHLKKEHPEVRNKMEIELNGKKNKSLTIKPVREKLLPNSSLNTLRFEIDL